MPTLSTTTPALKSPSLLAARGVQRLRSVATAALLLVGGGPACSSSAPTLDLGAMPSTGGMSGSAGSASGSGGSLSGGAGNGGAGNSGAGNSGAGNGGAGNGGAGNGGAGAGSSGATTVAAGSSNGGAAGKAGGSSAGAGGSVEPAPFQCDPSDGSALGTPNDCSPADPNDSCQNCVQAKCCTEYAECFAVNPGNQCGWGGPLEINGIANYGGEIACLQDCLIAVVANTGIAPESSQVNSCANHCATSINNGATKECGSVIGSQTNALVGCLLNHCSTVCFGG